MPLNSNKGDLTSTEKLNYFVSWFGEFSEMEKGDFLEIIAKKYNSKIEDGNGNLTFGFKKLDLNEHSPSIFKCRMKLFEEWFPIWSEEEKSQLLTRLKNLDENFINNFDETIETNKLPVGNLLYASYEISDEVYDELRKNNQQANGNSLNSIDLLNTASENESSINSFNGSINGLSNGKKEDDESLDEINKINGVLLNGHSDSQNGFFNLQNGHSNSQNEHSSLQNGHSNSQNENLNNENNLESIDDIKNEEPYLDNQINLVSSTVNENSLEENSSIDSTSHE